MDDHRARRLATNEALFRHANEALRRSDDAVMTVAGFVCECADPECEEKIDVPGEVYLEVRRDPVRFIISPGHADARIERVREETDRYHIVEKIGPGAEVAQKLNPRRS